MPPEAALNTTVASLKKAHKRAKEKAGVQSKEGKKLNEALKKELEATRKKAREFDEQAQFDLEIYEVVLKMKTLDFEDPGTFDKHAEDFYSKFILYTGTHLPL